MFFTLYSEGKRLILIPFQSSLFLVFTTLDVSVLVVNNQVFLTKFLPIVVNPVFSTLAGNSNTDF